MLRHAALIARKRGPLRRVDGKLRAGSLVLDENNIVLPTLARATSLGFSLYVGNRRVASVSVLGAGKPGDIGAYADAELVDIVLRKREVFKGTIQRGGQAYLSMARPLYLGNGEGAPEGNPGGFSGLMDQFALYHKALSPAEVQQRFEALDYVASTLTQPQADAFYRSEIARWKDVVKKANIPQVDE